MRSAPVAGISAPSADKTPPKGVTFVVPLLLDIVRSFEAGKTRCRKVHLVWAVRTAGTLILERLSLAAF